MGMKNDGQKQQVLHQGVVGGGGGRTNGFIPSSFRAISSYLRIVSNGASTVARSAASVASSIVDRDDDADHDQVCLCAVLRYLEIVACLFGYCGNLWRVLL